MVVAKHGILVNQQHYVAWVGRYKEAFSGGYVRAKITTKLYR